MTGLPKSAITIGPLTLHRRLLAASSDPLAPRTLAVLNAAAALGAPMTGCGEPGVPPIAPAVVNACAKLTGTRLRNLPFFPGATMGG